MDLSKLASIFANTLADEDAPRKVAEKQLKAFEGVQGYTPALLRMMTIAEIPVQVKQAAAVKLKNLVDEYWTIEEGQYHKILEADRKLIRDNLVESYIFQPAQPLRVQMIQCLFLIIRHDFPTKWDLMPIVMKNYHSKDSKRIFGALQCTRLIFKKYQFRTAKRREKVFEIINITFPIMLEILKMVVKSDSVESCQVMHVIIKGFYRAIMFHIPEILRKEETLKQWMGLIMAVLVKMPSAEQNPKGASMAQLCQMPIWKAKKWAATVCHRIFSRFGRPGFVTDGGRGFARMFYDNFGKPLTLQFMSVLKVKLEGAPVTPRVLKYAWAFLQEALEHKEMYALIRGELRFILECVYHTLRPGAEDVVLWKEDPHEFVRRNLDTMEECHDPRLAAAFFTIMLVKHRTRDSLNLVLTTITSHFNAYANASPQERVSNMILIGNKEASMNLLESLRKLLTSENSIDKFRGPVEEALVKHVLPEFQSPVGFLRSRACSVLGQYSKFDYSNQDVFVVTVVAVVTALNDKELPVKMDAAMALERMMRTNTQVVPVLKAKQKEVSLVNILNRLFELFEELGNDAVAATLGTLIGEFGADIAPYARELTSRMVTKFLTLFRAEAEDDEQALTAAECLQALNAIFIAVRQIPQAFPALEPIVQPLLTELLTENGIEFMEDVCELLATLTYHAKPQISDLTWSYFPKLIEACNGWGLDYVGTMLPVFDNYIHKGNARFVSNKQPNYVELLLTVVNKFFFGKTKMVVDDYDHADDEKELDPDQKPKRKREFIEAPHPEIDQMIASRILEMIVCHSRYKIDQYVPGILKVVVEKLISVKSDEFKYILCDILATCVYYNPALFYRTCQQLDSQPMQNGKAFSANAFNQWLSLLPHMKRKRREKLACVGLSALCLVPLSSAPQTITKDFFAEMLVELLAVMRSRLTAIEEKRKKMAVHEERKKRKEAREKRREEAAARGEDVPDEDEKGEGDEDVELVDSDAEHEGEEESDEELLLPSQVKNFNDVDADKDTFVAKEDGDEAEQSLDSFAAQVHNSLWTGGIHDAQADFWSPMEELDQFICFSDALQNLSSTQREFYALWTKALNAERVQALDGVLKEASSRKQQAAEAEAAKAAKAANNPNK